MSGLSRLPDVHPPQPDRWMAPLSVVDGENDVLQISADGTTDTISCDEGVYYLHLNDELHNQGYTSLYKHLESKATLGSLTFEQDDPSDNHESMWDSYGLRITVDSGPLQFHVDNTTLPLTAFGLLSDRTTDLTGTSTLLMPKVIGSPYVWNSHTQIYRAATSRMMHRRKETIQSDSSQPDPIPQFTRTWRSRPYREFTYQHVDGAAILRNRGRRDSWASTSGVDHDDNIAFQPLFEAVNDTSESVLYVHRRGDNPLTLADAKHIEVMVPFKYESLDQVINITTRRPELYTLDFQTYIEDQLVINT